MTETASFPMYVTWIARAALVAVLVLVVGLIDVPGAHHRADRVDGPSTEGQGRIHRVAAPTRPQATVGALAGSLAWQIAAPWPGLQQPSGRFRNILGGGTRYGEATLGYALLQAGARSHKHAQVHAGLKALALAVRRSSAHARPSVFENLALAAAYNLASRSLSHSPIFRREKPRWEAFLASRQFKEINSTHNYDNHFIADSVSTLELLRSGLTSTDPSTVVGNPDAALAAVEQLINVRIPSMAASGANDVRGLPTFVLSDPPDNPLSYQGLSLGLYARAIRLLGPRASDAARRTLVDATQASWWLTAPDGDLGWYGRSDEESWGLAATAYGAGTAADQPGVPAARVRDFRALVHRSLMRLRTYGTGPRGLNITPAVRAGRSNAAAGLDSSAGGPSFTGITLMMLNWAVPQLRGAGPATGSIGADAQGGVVFGDPASRVAVVRHGDVWFGLKLKPTLTRPNDLRYDFGLHLLKVRRGNGWVDVVAPRPQPGVAPTQARTPVLSQPGLVPGDSAGPILLAQDGSQSIPYGDNATVGRHGKVQVQGGWETGAGAIVRSGVAFNYSPTAKGIRITVPRQPQDRVQYSVFFPGIAAPVRKHHSLTGTTTRASWSGPAHVRLEPGYASAVDARIVRARITFSRADGPVRLKLNATR